MPASAATTGRTAASLRAAIVLSAEVSVSTIHSRADVASAPSTSLRQRIRVLLRSDGRFAWITDDRPELIVSTKNQRRSRHSAA